MQKIMRMANKDMTVPKKIFEINKDHKLIRNLLKVYKADENDEFIATVVEQLFETAQLQEGDLVDPHKLVQRSNDILMKSSDWYTSVKKL
jgi:molecular chaperone HtpG